jgi:dienelactone hydrolase
MPRALRRACAVAMILVGCLVLGGCTLLGTPGAVGEGSYGESISGPGTGRFTFSDPSVPGGDPMDVWYVAPDGGASTADIVIVMHGARRHAEDYRDVWEPLVRKRDVLVVVPEFSEDDFPGTSYNTGNMLDEDGEPQPKDEWAFPVIEALFDHVVSDVDSDATDYAIFGHSAGAQFVHRFLEFAERPRVRVAVAANAGWYTMMDDSVDFPYGLNDSPSSEEDMGPALASDLVILLGADDIDPESDSLRRDPGSDAQGDDRLERGLNFFLTSRETADRESLPFDWRLIVLPGIAHSHTEMGKAALPLVLASRS